MRARHAAIFLAVTMLLTVSLAGCLEDGGGGSPSELSEQEARDRFQQGLGSLGSTSGDLPARYSMNATFTSTNESGQQTGFMIVLVDTDAQVAIFSIQGEALDAGTSSGGMSSGIDAGVDGAFLVGQVAKTSFMGTTEGLFAVYNESADPVTGFDDVRNNSLASSMPGAGGGSPADPGSVLDIGREIPDNATVEHEVTTYEGEPALEMDVSYDEGDGSVEFTAIMYLDPDRPALMEGSFEGTEAEGATLPGTGSFRIAFDYGDDASHPNEDALVRAETMTLHNTTSSEPSFGSSEVPRWTNLTIQPSADPGTVPLEEATAYVRNGSASSGDDGMGEVLVTLPLEDGSAASAEAELSYEDADGDGHVSPGDVLRMRQTQEGSFELTLEDEVTGLVLVPALGPLAVLAALGAAGAVAVRGRPDR